ncbi:hypothetical protein [Nocardia sp. NPDC059691]|uniref:hypothetical protein n=1 Tax=Nocardia sp. NPDC059691 TaxID=3346908 RepID=UPI0036B7E35A
MTVNVGTQRSVAEGWLASWRVRDGVIRVEWIAPPGGSLVNLKMMTLGEALDEHMPRALWQRIMLDWEDIRPDARRW